MQNAKHIYTFWELDVGKRQYILTFWSSTGRTCAYIMTIALLTKKTAFAHPAHYVIAIRGSLFF